LLKEESIVNKFIDGKSIYLRPIHKNDAEKMASWMNDQEVREYLTIYLPVTSDMEDAWIDSLKERQGKDVVLAVVLKETDEHVGNIGLHSIGSKNRTATLGIVIGAKKYWGKGIGTEAIELILDYAFNTLNLRKVNSIVVEGNTGSLRIHEKNGFNTECAHKKEHSPYNGANKRFAYSRNRNK